MPRGGKRPGAGRKSELNFQRELQIGSWCEVRSSEFYNIRLAEAERQQHENYYRLVDPLDQKSIREREEFTRISSLRFHQEAIQDALIEDAIGKLPDGDEENYLEDPPERIFRPPPRNYGKRKDILEFVKHRVRLEFDLELSIHTIDRCWKIYRARAKKQRAEST